MSKSKWMQRLFGLLPGDGEVQYGESGSEGYCPTCKQRFIVERNPDGTISVHCGCSKTDLPRPSKQKK